jgi:cyanophycinase
MKNSILSLLLFYLFMTLTSCHQVLVEEQETLNQNQGVLYIIGGGKRPASMVAEIIDLAGLKQADAYTVVLPMASEEPDTSFYYFNKSLMDQGISNVHNFNITDAANITRAQIDSIVSAHLVYITGGVQTKFMDVVLNTPVHKAIKAAYKEGAVIAGTSAGAAVQSKKMITGNEYKHPEYTGDFRTIEEENIEIKEGLGLLETAIVDQHFIWRMRMNRLISAAIENPDEILIGIDESTAIIVEGDSATVTGLSQVVVLSNTMKEKKVRDGLLGSEGMELSVYLPGDRFSLLP